MKKIETVIGKYEDVIKLFELGKKLFFVPRELGKFEIYEGVIVGNTLEYDECAADVDAFLIQIQIDLKDNHKHLFDIVIGRRQEDENEEFNQSIQFYCSKACLIDYEYFLSIGLAKDYLLKKNEAYMKTVSKEIETFKNYKNI